MSSISSSTTPRFRASTAVSNGRGGAFTLTDLQSTNGTFIGDKQVVQAELIHGDEIILGSYTLQFIDAAPDDKPPVSSRVFLEDTDKAGPPAPVDRTWSVSRSEEGTEHTTAFTKPYVLIGRGRHCDVELTGKDVSLNHVLLVKDKQELIVVNVADNKPLQINGMPAPKKSEYEGSFKLRVGLHELTIAPQG